MINNHCYEFKLKVNEKGFLDDFIDATYILTLDGSSRLNNIMLQLQEYIPTKKIFLVNNRGYKKCNKQLIEHIPPYDLTDAYFNAINHSLQNNFNNILIFEDDFIFAKKIKDKKVINELKIFMETNKNKLFYYNLGPIPMLFYPNINIFDNTYKGIYCTSSHAIIYPKSIQLDIINRMNTGVQHWDSFLMKTYTNYFYRYPLCYQLFPQTENQKYWYTTDQNSLFQKICNFIIININKLLNLNNKPQPGFNIVYISLFILHYFITLLIIILILKLITKTLVK